MLANFPDKYEVYQGCTPEPEPGPVPSWPPAEFRNRQGAYACFRGPRDQEPGIGPYWKSLTGQLDLSPHIAVEEGDFVIGTGQQLHDLCQERGILHLLFRWLCDQLVYIGPRLRGSRHGAGGAIIPFWCGTPPKEWNFPIH